MGRSFPAHSRGFEIETEIVVRACKEKLEIAEVPSFESPRRYGDSNLNAWRDGRRVLRTLLHERVGEPEPLEAPGQTAAWTVLPAEPRAARAHDEARACAE